MPRSRLAAGALGPLPRRLSGEDASVNTTEDRPFPNTLREVDLPFVPHEECDTEYVYAGRVLEPMMFCAGAVPWFYVQVRRRRRKRSCSCGSS